MWLIKLSIGLFLLRLAFQRRYKYTLCISIIIVGVWSLAIFFWNIFQCSPVPAQWDYTILTSDPKSHCVSVDEIVSAAYSLSALTILSDWLYALIPIPMIWQVKMNRQTKWSVIAVLGLGVFASIATLIRLKFLSDLKDVSDILRKLCYLLHVPWIYVLVVAWKSLSSLTLILPRCWHGCDDMDIDRTRNRYLGCQSSNNPPTSSPMAG
jgi:hypothetical protein